MKYILTIFLLFFSFCLFSQQKYSKEISLITDNDLYVSTFKDRYYTSGIFLNFRYLSKQPQENLTKRIFQWEIGHKMYTPFKAVVTSIDEHDRAFAAYLYGGFGFTNVYKNDKIFSTSVEIGVIGKNAFGRELQDFIHDLYGFKKATGWDYQIKNALGINFKSEYISSLTKNTSNLFDLTWINTANIGTVFTDISSGIYGRIGLKPLQKLANSIAFKTNLNNKNTNQVRKPESFLFIKPSVRVAFYDATIEGSFLNSNSEVTTEIEPLIFQLEIGFKFTANRFHFAYIYQYNSNKSKGLRFSNGNKFGTIGVYYMLF